VADLKGFQILFMLPIFIPILLNSCKKNEESQTNPRGVILTFDDNHAKDWVWADSILSVYNWKATFCISHIGNMSSKDISLLKSLENNGHEIAGHGYLHVNAVDFIGENDISTYIDEEITPMLDSMEQYFDPIISFAYPYGSRSLDIDSVLFNYFHVLRGTTYGRVNSSELKCVYNSSPLVFGLGIDSHYSHFSMTYLTELLDYARENQIILIFYSHDVVSQVTGPYQTNISTLEYICQYITENHMTFYSLSDLINIE